MRVRITLIGTWGLLLGLTYVGGSVAWGQQLFRYTQYMVNPFLSNPAVAGTLPYSPVSLSFRNQWAGFQDGPRTQVLSGHTALPNRIGVGGVFYSDNTGGAIRQTGVEFSGSYTVDLNNFDAVSFGLGLMANQWSFDNAGLEVWDVEDPSLNMGMEKSLSVDAHFGALVSGQNYSFGLAVPQLIQARTGLSTSPQSISSEENQRVRHYRFMGSYRYDINRQWQLEPAALVRVTERTPAQLDLYARVRYEGMVWAMAGFRTGESVLFGAGAEVANFGFAYSYDLSAGAVRYLSPHSHEITVSYLIPGRRGFSQRSLMDRKMLERRRIVN
jgi:type IX secretion system PorP/SprF family membrane protein